MNRDVFLSLLALDSYNRGSGRSLTLPSSTHSGLSLIKSDSNTILPTSIASGFYASSYEVYGIDGIEYGSTVVSYRGTNFDLNGGASSPAAVDILNGWSLFTGIGPTSQAYFAERYFKFATGGEFGSNVGVGNAILTGHSLGGGLAGYVGTQGWAETVAFDPIPYAQAAILNSMSLAFAATVSELELSWEDVAAALANSLIPTAQIGSTVVTIQQFADFFAAKLNKFRPEWDFVTGYRLEGEVAGPIEELQTVLGVLLSGVQEVPVPLQSSIALLGLSQLGMGILNSGVDQGSHVDTRPNYGAYTSLTDAVALHSQSLLTTILFGEKQWELEGGQDLWKSSFKFVAKYTSSNEIAGRLGIISPNDRGSLMSSMMRIL